MRYPNSFNQIYNFFQKNSKNYNVPKSFDVDYDKNGMDAKEAFFSWLMNEKIPTSKEKEKLEKIMTFAKDFNNALEGMKKDLKAGLITKELIDEFFNTNEVPTVLRQAVYE